jgi:hypothetical protein
MLTHLTIPRYIAENGVLFRPVKSFIFIISATPCIAPCIYIISTNVAREALSNTFRRDGTCTVTWNGSPLRLRQGKGAIFRILKVGAIFFIMKL